MECHRKMASTKKEEGREAQKSKKCKNATNKRHITCFCCRKKGHYQSECPENEDNEEEEMDIVHLTLNGQGIIVMMVDQ